MKKKILFINGHLNVGGVEKSLVDILQHMDYERFDIDLLLLEELGDYKEEIPPQVNIILKSLRNTYGPLIPCLFRCLITGDIFSFKMRLIFLAAKYFGPKQLRLSRKLLTEDRNYDCAIGFRSGICTQVAVFAANAKKKITWWHHGEFNVPVKAYKQVVENCDAVVAVSQSCGDMLQQYIPEVRPLLFVIPNMVDVKALEKKAGEICVYREKCPHYVTVCRISPEKHVENILYAAEQLKQQGFCFRWHIVGDGALRSELESRAAAMGISDCVCFEGSKTNPYPYIKNACLYVHPSYVESQGLTILEAMALGIPCVVTKSRGPCEFIQDGINGILVEQSPQALTAGVIKVMNNKMLYDWIKRNTSCHNNFLPKHVIEMFESLMEE